MRHSAAVLGSGALGVWPDLPCEIQERLFEESVADDEALRHAPAPYLYDHHPRLTHRPQM